MSISLLSAWEREYGLTVDRLCCKRRRRGGWKGYASGRVVDMDQAPPYTPGRMYKEPLVKVSER